jgi:hypothetical protein
MRYTDLGIGHGHKKRTKPTGNLHWGAPWADWEEQDDEGTDDITLCVSDRESGGSDEDDSGDN